MNAPPQDNSPRSNAFDADDTLPNFDDRPPRAAMCGPAERASVVAALASAITHEDVDTLDRAVVARMDDGVLAYLVRALVNGQLAEDGRLFLRPEDLVDC